MGEGRESIAVEPHKTRQQLSDSQRLRPSPCRSEYRIGLSSGLEEQDFIFAIGNLILLSPDQHNDLSSSGITMRHTAFSSLRFIFSEMLTWLDENPHPSTLMLISDDPSAFSLLLALEGEKRSLTVIPAYPQGVDPYPPSVNSSQGWRWKRILEELPLVETVLETSAEVINHNWPVEPLWFCRDCQFESDTCDDFIEHVYGYDHDVKRYIYSQFLEDTARMACEFPEFPETEATYAARMEAEEYLKQREREREEKRQREKESDKPQEEVEGEEEVVDLLAEDIKRLHTS